MNSVVWILTYDPRLFPSDSVLDIEIFVFSTEEKATNWMKTRFGHKPYSCKITKVEVDSESIREGTNIF